MFPDYLSALLCTTMIHCIALKPLSFLFSLLKRFQEDNSMDRRVGSGRRRTNTTEGNENLI